MQTRLRLLLVSLFAGFVAAPAWGVVNVSFPNTGRYIDVDPVTERDSVQRAIAEHLRALGDRYLPPGQVLNVEVLDIDLAGRLDTRHAGSRETRIVRGGADFPRIELRYSLEGGGRVLDRGEETLSDLNYQQDLKTTVASESLGYEKRMLDRWFRDRFVAHRAAGTR